MKIPQRVVLAALRAFPVPEGWRELPPKQMPKMMAAYTACHAMRRARLFERNGNFIVVGDNGQHYKTDGQSLTVQLWRAEVLAQEWELGGFMGDIWKHGRVQFEYFPASHPDRLTPRLSACTTAELASRVADRVALCA